MSTKKQKSENQLLKFIKVVILAILIFYVTLFIVCLTWSGGNFNNVGVWIFFWMALGFFFYVIFPTSVIIAIIVLVSKNIKK